MCAPQNKSGRFAAKVPEKIQRYFDLHQSAGSGERRLALEHPIDVPQRADEALERAASNTESSTSLGTVLNADTTWAFGTFAAKAPRLNWSDRSQGGCRPRSSAMSRSATSFRTGRQPALRHRPHASSAPQAARYRRGGSPQMVFPHARSSSSLDCRRCMYTRTVAARQSNQSPESLAL